jgi:hypothetical protein
MIALAWTAITFELTAAALFTARGVVVLLRVHRSQNEVSE